MESIHKGHRQRLRKRFADYGLDSLSDIEAIELLLYHAVPRRDTNVLAHALLRHFGSYHAVLEAQVPDLMQVNGIGQTSAELIRLVAELGRRYQLDRRPTGKPILDSKDAGEYLLPLFAYETSEQLYVLCLDSRCTVKTCRRIAIGMANKVDFSSREIVDVALRCGASHVVIAHNHLSGTALPSSADISVTGSLKRALGLIGVELDDHIIVCDGDFVSLKDSGYMGS